jgi:glycosyltransferase involved in cell wall biosynthesis
MKVHYISACFDSSGYAESARNYIQALQLAGVDISLTPISFEQQKPNLGSLNAELNALVNKPNNAQIQIIHLTPENYVRFDKKGKYNIAYTTWETSKLPDQWVPLLNSMNEVWVPSEHNKRIFIESGVLKPIYVFPHAVSNKVSSPNTEELGINKEDNEFMFYSIFQWTERKNPTALLKAYLTEFTSKEKVSLVLKTYFMNPQNPTEKDQLKEAINNVKKRLYLPDMPKILLISDLLSQDQIQRLHETGDCFVSLHRCEGFGMPIAEAMQASKPVIVTDYGGPSDFVKNNVTGFTVPYMMTPCYGMPWPTYNGSMEWAEADVMAARKHMRHVYENRNIGNRVGKTAKEWLDNNFSHQKIGNNMLARLEEISKRLR